jgi:hypothetical protein
MNNVVVHHHPHNVLQNLATAASRDIKLIRNLNKKYYFTFSLNICEYLKGGINRLPMSNKNKTITETCAYV